jgi:DNA mismatch repair protein MutL
VFDAGPVIGRQFWPQNQGARLLDPHASGGSATVDVEALQPQAADAGGLFADDATRAGDDAAFKDSDADNAAAAVGDAARETATAPVAEDSEIPPLFQLRRTYMMYEHEHGVVLIDQHSAHERVIYEQFMRVLEQGAAPAQRLLFPLTLHLSPAESDAFEQNRATLERLGFEIEGFGGATLIVRAVPMPHPRFDAERCLRETLATLSGDRDPGAHARHERLAATVACKAAIKAGDALSQGEMRALFASLRDTVLPAHDVHGRATIVQLTWDELERRFGRR